MKSNWMPQFWDFAAPCLFGSVGLALLTVVGRKLQLNFAPVAFLYLIVVVVVSLRGSFAASLLVIGIAIALANYFFADPFFSLKVTASLDVAAVIAFSTTAFVITYLMSRLRRSLRALQASQDRLRLVVDTIPAQVWSAQPDGSFDFLSRRWQEYTGLAATAGLGWGWTATVHPEDRARFLDEWRAVVAVGTPFEAQARVRRADGDYRRLLIRAVPLHNAAARIVRWYGTSTDVEDQRRTEEALRERAELLDLTHDTVFVRDMNDVITYWNRGAEMLYGWTREEALGKVSYALTQTIFPAPLDEITAALTRDGRWEGELIHRRRDGTEVVVASRWSLQRDDRRRPAAILETDNDITRHKEAEESLRLAHAELAHVTRVTTMGELAASIAHEINQPLAAIVADVHACQHWLATVPPPVDSMREALAAVAKDAERAAEVIGRIRALLAREAVAYQPCDLNAIVADVLPLVRPELARHGIAIHTSLTPSLPPIMADRIQLQQVLLNLVVNAVEAIREVPRERRRIALRSRGEQRGHSAWAVLTVEDAGIGFCEADTDRLFEAFHSTKPGGLGMGLSISRSIVERHGGQLWARANADHGATFHVALPAAP